MMSRLLNRGWGVQYGGSQSLAAAIRHTTSKDYSMGDRRRSSVHGACAAPVRAEAVRRSFCGRGSNRVGRVESGLDGYMMGKRDGPPGQGPIDSGRVESGGQQQLFFGGGGGGRERGLGFFSPTRMYCANSFMYLRSHPATNHSCARGGGPRERSLGRVHPTLQRSCSVSPLGVGDGARAAT